MLILKPSAHNQVLPILAIIMAPIRTHCIFSLLCFSPLILPSLAEPAADGSDFLHYVNPLIGTVNGGHVFPGATLPFGMAKAVADVNTELQGGFSSDNGDSKAP